MLVAVQYRYVTASAWHRSDYITILSLPCWRLLLTSLLSLNLPCLDKPVRLHFTTASSRLFARKAPSSLVTFARKPDTDTECRFKALCKRAVSVGQHYGKQYTMVLILIAVYPLVHCFLGYKKSASHLALFNQRRRFVVKEGLRGS